MYKESRAIQEMNKIKKLVNQNKYEKALERIDDCLFSYPNNEYVILEYAIILGKLGNYDKEEEILAKIIHTNIDEIKYGINYEYAIIYNAKQDYHKSVLYYERVLEESNGTYKNDSCSVEVAKFYIREQRNYQKAYAVLKKYGNKDNSKILCYMADCKFMMKQYEEAKKLLNMTKSKNSDITNARINYLKGQIESEMGSYYKAKEYYQKALDYSIDKDLYYNCELGLANLDLLYGLYDDVIKKCQNLYSCGDSFYMKKYYNATKLVECNAYISMNSYDNAIECCLKMHEDTLEKYRFKMKNLAKTKYHFKRYNETIEYYNKIINCCEYFYKQEAYYYIILCYFKLGDDTYKKYIDIIDYKKLPEENKKHIEVIKNLSKLDENDNCKSEFYSVNQLHNYSKQRAINHCDKKHYRSENIKSYFNPLIDLEKLYDEALLFIDDKNLVNNSLWETYIVKYPNIGIENNAPTDYLAIVTLPNSKNILTMYPTRIKQLEPKSKIKVKSQIEKFNERYGKKIC